ncbi:MAG: LamG-like jellyroll fold domain-containing protein [Sedimentisphaeraceae bacterium JB056]
MRIQFKMVQLLVIIISVFISRFAFAGALVDDSTTIALWHMDETIPIGASQRPYVPDDNSETSRTAYHLALGDNSDTPGTRPALTTGDGGMFDEAMQFSSASGQMMLRNDVWNGHNAVRVELWFKQDTSASGEQTLISAMEGSVWEIRLDSTNSVAKAYVFGTSGGYADATVSYTKGQWMHVVMTASACEDVLVLNVDGDFDITALNGGMNIQTGKRIYVGCKQTGSRHFDGLIDEVKVSLPASPAVVLWHMDETIPVGLSQRPCVPDDNIASPRTAYNIALGDNANTVSKYPTLTTGGGGKFEEAMQFSSSAKQMMLCNDVWNGYDSVRVELWFNQNTGISTDQTLISAAEGSVWEIRLNSVNNVVKAYVFGTTGGYAVASVSYAKGQWTHLVMTASTQDDTLVLDVDGSTDTRSLNNGVSIQTDKRIYVGCKYTDNRNFDGFIDEVSVCFTDFRGGSPKLFFTSADILTLRQKLQENDIEPIWDEILQKADDYCTPTSADYIDPQSSWFTEGDYGWYGRDLQGWVETIGFAYQMTGDSFYGKHGAAILEASTAYEAPVGSLLPMNIDMMRTLAVGYDWLSDAMTADQKAAVEACALDYIEWSFDYFPPTLWTPYHNFNGVAFGGTGLLALVMEDVYPDDSPQWIADAESYVEDWFDNGFDQTGAYVEGHDYMYYGLSNGIAFADALRATKRSNLILHSHVGMIEHYLSMIRLPGMDTYEGRNDSRYSTDMNVSILSFMNAVNSPLLKWMWNRSELYWEEDYHVGGYSPLRIVWDNDITPLDIDQANEPLAEHFTQRGLVTFRSGWDTDDTLFTMEAGPYYDVTHNQADKGHFGFYGLGHMWAADTIYGNNRDLNGRCQTVAHNCILVDGVGQALTGASYGTDGEILTYANYSDYGYVVADATSAYNINSEGQSGAVVDHAIRHSVYVRPTQDKPAYAVVFDDIQKDQSSHSYTWQLLSWDNMDIDISGANPVVIPMEYVETPEGTSGTGSAVWTITVPQTGTYELWGRVRANGESVSGSDSFKVQIDSMTDINWYLTQTSDRLWTWEKVTDTSSKSYVSFSLTAGTHQIKIKTRETGAQLAAAFLTSNLSQSAPVLPQDQGIYLKAEDATVTLPMEFYPADSSMKVVMDGASTISYGFDFYEPDDGRVPELFPRLRASCNAVAPKFIAFMMPCYSNQTAPAVTFTDVQGCRKITVTWADRTDEMTWTSSGVTCDIDQ